MFQKLLLTGIANRVRSLNLKLYSQKIHFKIHPWLPPQLGWDPPNREPNQIQCCKWCYFKGKKFSVRGKGSHCRSVTLSTRKSLSWCSLPCIIYCFDRVAILTSSILTFQWQLIGHIDDAMKLAKFTISFLCSYPNTLLLSWKCPGHVPDISLGHGHIQKSCWQNWMISHIFCRICSVMCPQRVLRVSHVSSLPPGTKKTCESTKSSKFTLGR